jgi:hypothetical protein
MTEVELGLGTVKGRRRRQGAPRYRGAQDEGRRCCLGHGWQVEQRGGVVSAEAEEAAKERR